MGYKRSGYKRYQNIYPGLILLIKIFSYQDRLDLITEQLTRSRTTLSYLSSTKNNLETGVTGCLISGSNSFLQLLEGPRQRIDRLYVTINADSRHKNVVMLKKFPWKCKFRLIPSNALDRPKRVAWLDSPTDSKQTSQSRAANQSSVATRIHAQGS